MTKISVSVLIAIVTLASFLQGRIEGKEEVKKLNCCSAIPVSEKKPEIEPLFKVDPAKEDYIKVAPGGYYFIHSDGKPFIPLGYNHNPDWPAFIESNPQLEKYNPKVTEEFFAFLHKSGVNTIRLMIETPQSGCLEKPIGTFQQEHVKWIDHIVTFARKADVKLIITPWDTFWMNHKWDICPYNSALGGPVVDKVDFITKPEVIEAQKKRLKFIIDRWGNTGVIFSWELLNEADLWWGGTPEQIEKWMIEMAAYVRDYEKKRWGRNHIVSLSTASATPSGRLGDVAFRNKTLDYATTHLYIGVIKAPDEPVGPASAENRGVTFALSAIKDRRPYMDGETGPIDRWITDQKLDDEVFHNMSWSHLASGGAGSGLRWPYRHPHHLSDGMYKTLSLMASFTRKVPWGKVYGKGFGPREVKTLEDWIGFSSGSDDAAIVWACERGKTDTSDLNISLKWSGESRKVNWRVYDTKTGKWISSGTADNRQGGVNIRATVAAASVAFILEGE